MFCYTHKNAPAVGVCKNCGCGVCGSCAEKGFPALCPACLKAAAKKNIVRARQNNRILLYIGLFFAAVFLGVSLIIFQTDENPLWFLLNLGTLALAGIFVPLFLKNQKRKKKERATIKDAEALAALDIPAPPAAPALQKEDVREMLAEATAEIITKLSAISPAREVKTVSAAHEIKSAAAATNTPKAKPEPKTVIKEKTNPFVTEPKTKEPVTTSSSKSKKVSKIWVCDCGRENMTQKLFCMECGQKRTKEMLANAREI